jgi:hypothetical protein
MSKAEIVPEEQGFPSMGWKSWCMKDLPVCERKMLGGCERIFMGQDRGNE